MSKDGFGVLAPPILFVGGPKSSVEDVGPVSLPFRDGVEEDDKGRPPLESGVPVLLIVRSESNCSIFCGFNRSRPPPDDDDESKSEHDGSASSSSLRLFVLLLDA